MYFILLCLGVYNMHIFSALNNFKLQTACYTLQLAKPCFFPLENRSYRYQKKEPVQSRWGCLVTKQQKFSRYNLNFHHHPISTVTDFKKKKTFCFNFDMKSVFVHPNILFSPDLKL